MTIEKHPVYKPIKRFLDIALSAVLLLLLSPIMLLLAAVIRLDSEGKALFKQKRVGRNGVPFTCYKFRTMYENAPQNMPKSAIERMESYITPIGRILRRTSLDELPQLYNVLRGDMSIVGPRPLISEEGEILEFRRRCGVTYVRPGITGLAQVSGRDGISDAEKARYDARYARNINFFGDAKIIFETARGMILSDEFSGIGH